MPYDGSEVVDGLAGQLGGELAGVLGAGEAGAGADDLQTVGRDAEPGAQAAQQQRDLGAGRPAVEVRLVDDEQELLVRVAVQPGRVASKTGRSSGRISMYSSIE